MIYIKPIYPAKLYLYCRTAIQSIGHLHLAITLLGKLIFAAKHNFAGVIESRVHSCVLLLYVAACGWPGKAVGS